jgi:hypothetical protein
MKGRPNFGNQPHFNYSFLDPAQLQNAAVFMTGPK